MKTIYIILFCCFIGACAPIPPDQTNIAELSANDLNLEELNNYQWPGKNWWHKYSDQQLNYLIDQALQHNPNLQATQAKLHQAQAQLAASKSIIWPQINANYQLNRQLYSGNYIYPPPLGGSYQTDNSISLQLDFDLDLWGRNKKIALASNYATQAAAADVEQNKALLISAVAQTYFQLQNANNQAIGIQNITTKLKEVLDITQDRFNNGLGNQADVDQAKSALASAMVQLSQAKENSRLLQNSLAELIGKSPNQLNKINAIAFKPELIHIPETLPMQLISRRADIQAAKFIALASGAQVSAAKANFLPNINLTAMAGFMSLGMDKLFNGGSKTYGVGPIISMPIFNAGRLNAELGSKLAEKDMAISKYNSVVLGAVRELADALASKNALNKQISQQKEGMKAIDSAYKVSLARYKAGLGNFIQVLIAQNEALKQTIITTDLYSRAYLLDVQMNTALGGGYTSK